MSLFTNLSILNKFITAFALVLLFTAGLGVFAITRISSLDTSAEGLEANIAGDLGIAGMLRSGPQMFGLAAATAETTDPRQLAQLAAKEDEERKTFEKNWTVYQPTMDPGRESNDGNGFAGAFSQMSSDAVQVAHDVATGNQAAASALVTGPMAALNATYNRDIADDLSRQADLAAGHTASVSMARSSSVIGVCVALGAMMVTICGLVWLLISSIGKPIGNLTQTMRRLARG
ncbi:MAG TPA: MCP four helix bundle domain-containing protein, partial [Acidocella sp.]|nr:MCP four helix bundle domain-containing protein [Acidocella sp.]